MHPLALEDLLHQRNGGHARSKADYYKQHLFLRVQSHILGSDDDSNSETSSSGAASTAPTWSSRAATITNIPRTMSPKPMDEKNDAVELEEMCEDEEDAGNAPPRMDPYASLEAGGLRRPSVLVSIFSQEAVQYLYSFYTGS
jgi:hypothetical protein